MKRIAAVAVIAAAVCTLTGCGESLDQRIANRTACEAAGGKYVEYPDGIISWTCDLSTAVAPNGDDHE